MAPKKQTKSGTKNSSTKRDDVKEKSVLPSKEKSRGDDEKKVGTKEPPKPAAVKPEPVVENVRPVSASGRRLPTPRSTPRSKTRDGASDTSKAATSAPISCNEAEPSDETPPLEKETENTQDLVPIALSVDPWKDMDFGEQWERIHETEELPGLDADAVLKSDGDIGSAVVPVEKANPTFEGFVNIADVHTKKIVIDDALRLRLVYLDALNNDLTNLDWCDPVLWLRALNLNGNQISRLPKEFNLPCLLRLDLSFNPLESLEGTDMSNMKSLRHLLMEGCSLGTLKGDEECCPMSSLTMLAKLELQDNEIEEESELSLLTPLVSLIELDLSDNPVADGSSYRESALKALPNMKLLDKKATKMISSVRMDEMGDLRGDLMKKGVLEDNEDNSSCSCLAGNACLTPFTCADWPNRFKIAKEVRNKRGFSHGNI